MTEKHPKRPRDPNQLAKSIIDIATGQAPTTPPDDKDPAAVQRGRLGGLKGGKARAEKMSAEERRAAAKAAVKARWSKR
ncbi:MAG: histone H1 [Alphaproteobacteria bacterium]|nr:MAG: histone H1 [Alphaproteobacteria bacterium]